MTLLLGRQRISCRYILLSVHPERRIDATQGAGSHGGRKVDFATIAHLVQVIFSEGPRMTTTLGASNPHSREVDLAVTAIVFAIGWCHFVVVFREEKKDKDEEFDERSVRK